MDVRPWTARGRVSCLYAAQPPGSRRPTAGPNGRAAGAHSNVSVTRAGRGAVLLRVARSRVGGSVRAHRFAPLLPAELLVAERPTVRLADRVDLFGVRHRFILRMF